MIDRKIRVMTEMDADEIRELLCADSDEVFIRVGKELRNEVVEYLIRKLNSPGRIHYMPAPDKIEPIDKIDCGSVELCGAKLKDEWDGYFKKLRGE